MRATGHRTSSRMCLYRRIELCDCSLTALKSITEERFPGTASDLSPRLTRNITINRSRVLAVSCSKPSDILLCKEYAPSGNETVFAIFSIGHKYGYTFKSGTTHTVPTEHTDRASSVDIEPSCFPIRWLSSSHHVNLYPRLPDVMIISRHQL